MKLFYFLFGFVLFISTSHSFTQVISPTNNSIVTNLTQTISASISGSENVSTFIDWDNSLMGYWNFDYGNSTHVFDMSGNNQHGEYRGLVSNTNINFVRGNYSEFNQGDDHINISLNAPFETSGRNVSISAWIYISSYPSGSGGDNRRTIISRSDDLTNGYFGLEIDPGQRVSYRVRSSNTHTDLFSSTLLLNTWYHLIFVNGVNSSIYINAILDTTTTALTNQYTTSGPLYIGSSEENAEAFEYQFDGLIDEVMIFNRSLSEQEIQSLYNSQINNFYFNISQLNDNTQYNYTIYSINTSGEFIRDSYTFFTDTSYIIDPISTRNSSTFPSISIFSTLLSLLFIFFYL